MPNLTFGLSQAGFEGEYEEYQEDEEILQNSFQEIDCDNSNLISKIELLDFLDKVPLGSEFSCLLDSLKPNFETMDGSELDSGLNSTGSSANSEGIDFRAFKKATDKIPYVKNPKLQFVRGLKLDISLARRLKSGTLWDGLEGFKQMTLQDIEHVCALHARDVLDCLQAQWRRLKSEDQRLSTQIDTLSKEDPLDDFAGTMNKFMGEDGAILGSFGTQDFFHEGLEVKLGMADPQIFRAIIYENVVSKDSCKPFVTKNYGIFTTPMIEFARVLGNPNDFCSSLRGYGQINDVRTLIQDEDDLEHVFLFRIARGDPSCSFTGPKEIELLPLQKQFKDLINVYQALVSRQGAAKNNCTASLPRDLAVFPGDIGDSYCELMAEFQCLESLDREFIQFEKQFDGFFDDLGKMTFGENSFCLRGFQKVSSDSSKYKVSLHFYCDGTQAYIKLEDIRIKLHAQIMEADQQQQGPGIISAGAIKDSHWQQTDACAKLTVVVVGQRYCVYCENVHLENESVRKALHASPAEINQGLLGEAIFKQGRRTVTLEELMKTKEVKKAGLRLEEALVEYQYTGPMFQIWNSVLRTMPKGLHGNRYSTSIHTLVSAVIKTSRITQVPPNRRVYRGLGGMVLDELWSVGDKERGVKGGVEYGFLSTTLNKNIALEYSGVNTGKGVVFEINIGAIDNGAQLDSVSQYPNERELLFGPLSNLEVVDRPRVECFNGKSVFVIPLDININLKSQTIEEMIGKRKNMLLSLIKNMKTEFDFEICLITGKDERDFNNLDQQFEIGMKETECRDVEWFNSDHNFSLELQNIIEWKRIMLYNHLQFYYHSLDPPQVQVALNQALRNVTRRGMADLVKILVSIGAQTFSEDAGGNSALEIACNYGHTQLMKYIIENIVEVRSQQCLTLASRIFILPYIMGFSAISWATWVYGGWIAGICVVSIVGIYFLFLLFLLVLSAKIKTISLDHGLQPCGNPMRKSPLHISSERGYFGIACNLLEAGASQNARDIDGKIPLHHAVERGHVAIVSKMMRQDDTVSMFHLRMGWYLVIFFILGPCLWVYVDNLKIAGIVLVSLGLGIFVWILVQYSVIYLGRYFTIRGLIMTKDNQNRLPSELVPEGDQPLSLVILFLLEPFLIKRKIRLAFLNGHASNANATGKTVLHIASECGFEEMVTAILKARADVNACDHTGKTPLHYACHHTAVMFQSSPHARFGFAQPWKKSLSVIAELIEAGADKDIKDSTGNTAYSWASLCLSEESLKSKQRILRKLKIVLGEATKTERADARADDRAEWRKGNRFKKAQAKMEALIDGGLGLGPTGVSTV
jgi:ankyrin repeat protein